ncbi:MAG: ATP-binding cassette domain-containing protein, partial [Bacteroidota bacterium]
LGDLSLAQRQMVEIARLLWLGEQTEHQPVIVLDEPTTVLSKEETDTLFGLTEELRQRASVILITHRMSEVLQYTDRILVMRDGKDVARYESRTTTEGDLYKVMVGRELAGEYYHESEQIEPQREAILRLRGLSKRNVYQDVEFEVRRGEIVSLVGTVGSGKEAVCRAIMGIDQPDAGSMEFLGQVFKPKDPSTAVRCKIGYVPEDRRDEGLVLYMDIASNISLSKLDLVTRHALLSRSAERSLAKDWIKRLRIRTSSENTLCVNLSGGNQQKVVLAKWLAAQVDLLILDHPTRGIDVGAKEEVYALIRELTRQHIGIILMSDTLEEDIGLANRLLIFKDGRLVKEMPSAKGSKPTPLDLIEYIV